MLSWSGLFSHFSTSSHQLHLVLLSLSQDHRSTLPHCSSHGNLHWASIETESFESIEWTLQKLRVGDTFRTPQPPPPSLYLSCTPTTTTCVPLLPTLLELAPSVAQSGCRCLRMVRNLLPSIRFFRCSFSHNLLLVESTYGVSAVILSVVPSGPPHNLHGAVIAADSITLTWGLPLLEDQNGVITGYVVLVTQANSGRSYQVNSNTTNLNLTSLTPNSLYTFAVAAQTRRGRGPYSNSVTLHTSTDGKTTSTNSNPPNNNPCIYAFCYVLPYISYTTDL